MPGIGGIHTRAFQGLKHAVQNIKKSGPIAHFRGRAIQKTESNPLLHKARLRTASLSNISTPQKILLPRRQSITPLSPQQAKPYIPRQQPAPKPAAQQQPLTPEQQSLRNLEEQERVIDLVHHELPPVPTHDPGKPRSPNNINQAISQAQTVDELINLWNYINKSDDSNGLTFEQRFTLKQRFPGRLNMISKNSGQARLITNKILKVMIPDKAKRDDIGTQILERRAAEVFPNNLRSQK